MEGVKPMKKKVYRAKYAEIKEAIEKVQETIEKPKNTRKKKGE